MILKRLPMIAAHGSVRRLYLMLRVFFVGVFHSPLRPLLHRLDASRAQSLVV